MGSMQKLQNKCKSKVDSHYKNTNNNHNLESLIKKLCFTVERKETGRWSLPQRACTSKQEMDICRVGEMCKQCETILLWSSNQNSVGSRLAIHG